MVIGTLLSDYRDTQAYGFRALRDPFQRVSRDAWG